MPPELAGLFGPMNISAGLFSGAPAPFAPAFDRRVEQSRGITPLGQPRAPMPSEREDRGFRETISRILSGPESGLLSEEEDRQAHRQALVQAGLAGLAASLQPGANLGDALLALSQVGQQAGSRARQRMETEDFNEQVRGLFSMDPSSISPIRVQQLATMAMARGDLETAAALSQIGQRFAQSVPADAKDPAMIRMFEAAQNMSPERRAEFMKFMKMMEQGTTININPEDVLTKLDQAKLEAAQEAANSATRRIQDFNQLERLLDEGVDTGFAEEALLPMRQIAQSFGVGNAETLGQQEAFRAISNQLTLAFTTELPGQISNKELDFLNQAVPNLRNTVEGNRRLIAVARRQAEYLRALGSAMEEYFRENGTLSGFNEVRDRLADEILLSDLEEVTGNPFQSAIDEARRRRR